MTPEMLTTLTEQVAELVQTYSNNYPQFQRATYNETQVRVDFVNRFFKLLGWDVDNERGLPQHLREVTHEATVVVEEDGVHRSKKPDYSFKVGTEVLYFLETKKPAVNLTIDAAPAFQLRRYGWSGNLKVSVLTNFTDLYIYDCSVRPREGDDIGIAMIAHYHFDEYVERFEEIYNMLSKEAVLTGQFERHFGNIQGALRREPFDQYFLDQIRTWRMMLGEDILCNNPNVDAETLNIFVQRVLNRTIFLRICEDRCFENYESLKAITTYQDLRTMFAAADQKYDSGLFELLEEDRLTVSDSVIIEIFQSLYYPNNSYEFGVIDPYIIGQIYELFLDEALVIREDGHIETQEKPEVVDSQGAVNTPKNITDIIIEETLRPLYENRTPEEVAQYRIADICCGSGNFLLSAFEYIVNYHIEYYRNHDRENAERRGDIYQLAGSTNYILSYERKRSILKNNPLCIEVLKNINASGLYELTERTNDILDENYVGDDPKVIALKKALSVPFDEMERYATYVSDSSRFATHQGVKGLEFPRVMVILDDTESRGFLFSYEKLFGAKKQTATDLKNEKEGKDTSNRRTARLFYVACTRAMESLAVVAYSDNPELVKNTALNNGWFSEDEIQIIETQSVL